MISGLHPHLNGVLDVPCTTPYKTLHLKSLGEYVTSPETSLSVPTLIPTLYNRTPHSNSPKEGNHTQIFSLRPIMPLTTSPTLLICTTCGTQYAAPLTKPPRHCRICDDPRQFVPPTGQSFTTLHTLSTSPQQYRNVFSSVPQDSKVTEIYTEPKFGIGQSARLIKTPEGNVLWDCVSLLDEGTVREIEGRGGLKAVVISHPHFYT